MPTETMVNGSKFSADITLSQSTGTVVTFLTSEKYVPKSIELGINAQSASLDLAGGGLINKSLSFGGTGLSFTSLSSSGSIRYVGPLNVTASAFKEAVTVNSDINGWVNTASGAQVVASESLLLSDNAYLSGATFGNDQGMIITSPDILNSGYTVETLAFTGSDGELQFDIADASAFIRQIKSNGLSVAWHPAWKSITASALFNYRYLYSVSFPACTNIGGSAFAYCYSLTEANFSACTSIGVFAFQGCSSLTSVSFPVCTSIGNSVFMSCSSLTSVSFPVCTYIGSNAFYTCSSLASISFPACASISNGAFYTCPRLTEANFPVCTSIGNSAFMSCSSLASISFPACTNIESNAFQYCSSLTSVNFPACTSIGSGAFYTCRSLTEANFPACTTIGSSAFYTCRSLTEANFPACTYIGGSAFQKCYNLISLYLTGSSLCSLPYSNAFTSTPIAGYTTSTGGIYGSIYVPVSLYSQYISAFNWSYFSDRIVPYGAFESATGVSF